MMLQAKIADAKLVYRVLHAQLQQHLELLDCDLFAELQTRLQQAARADGVDVSDHQAWNDWLGG